MSEDEMRKEENLEHEVLDRLKNLEPMDFDYNALDASYVDAMLKARNIILDLYQKEKENNKDLWKAYLDVSNDRDNNYVEKDKVKELFYKKRGLIEREDLQELLGGKNAKNK